MIHRLLEICAYNIQSCNAAYQAGASRIELCSSPAEGGVTPGYGIVKYVLDTIAIPAYIMVRPRGGNFVYDQEELHIMHADIRQLKSMGCPGVVVGPLTADGRVNADELKRMTELAYPMQVTFHKAFDRVADPFAALEQIIAAGCHRILTSGLASTATEGTDVLQQLIQKAGNRIIIMPGGGVRSSNIRQLADATGAVELHSSAILPGTTNNTSDIGEITRLVEALNPIPKG